MANRRLILLFSIACYALASQSDGVVFPPGPGPKPTNFPPPPPKPSPNTTTTSTTPNPPAPNTTTTTTTTTSPKPPAPNTTTTSTTTHPPPTPSPNTTTTAKPTPQPPTPPPSPVDPQQGTWTANYTNSKNICLVLQAAIQIDIPYTVANTTKTLKLNVPPKANFTGSCSNDSQSLTLKWNPNGTLVFNFVKVNKTKFELQSISIEAQITIPGQGQKIFKMNHKKEEFVTPLEKSYKCYKEQGYNLTDAKEKVVGELQLSHLQIQAFRNASNTNFDEALDCAGSQTSDVVPIAVGCALAVLVLVVLGAYLWGRRRSQARGYLSM